jgi:uncharacterized protein involved in response to NO
MGLAWAGVLHWLLHAAGYLADYRPVFHAIAQIQGFMTCFAAGFLFTAIPRRTGTAPPSPVEMGLALALPPAVVLAAWWEHLAISQALWLALVITIIAFAVRRFLDPAAARRPPVSFIWIPLAFGMGVAGSILTAAPSLLGDAGLRIHDLGRLLLLQGLFVGLVAGVGGMVIPLITCGDAPPDSAGRPADRRARLGYLAAAALLVLSFWIEVAVSARAGLGLRAAVALALLIAAGRIHRLPRLPGWHRRLVWLSAWLIPAGYVLAACFPAQKKAGLHVVFIGGFALMAFAVGLHVALAHGAHERLVKGKPWQVPLFGGLLLLAAGLRALVDFDAGRFFVWLGAASASFLLATLFWAALALRSPAGARGAEAQPR